MNFSSRNSSRFALKAFVFTIILALVPVVASANSEQVLHIFNEFDHGFPSSTLVFDPAGNLYGATAGSVFEISISGTSVQFQTLATFPRGDDAGGKLLRDSAGNLYGGTWQGGVNSCGFIYRLSPTSQAPWTETIIHEFSWDEGCGASYGLVSDAAGNLYGVTGIGGGSDEGVAYELSPNAGGSWTYKVLYQFTDTDGRPGTSLIFDSNGNLFCGTEGSVIELSPNSDGTWTESTAYAFNGTSDGFNPLGDLMFDSAGNLYLTNQASGAYLGGTALKLTPNGSGGWTSTLLHSFGARGDGYYPYGGLVADSSGNLYGNTLAGGGADGDGIVYELSPGTDGIWTETFLRLFGPTGSPKGTTPEGSLVFDSVGNLYGTTTTGGDPSCYPQAGGCGVVYRLTP